MIRGSQLSSEEYNNLDELDLRKILTKNKKYDY